MRWSMSCIYRPNRLGGCYNSIFIEEFANSGTRAFEPPGTQGRGNDWILVVDDAAKNFSYPGKI